MASCGYRCRLVVTAAAWSPTHGQRQHTNNIAKLTTAMRQQLNKGVDARSPYNGSDTATQRQRLFAYHSSP
ncbi:hypothetical protein BDN67DRAFT_971870 [Paxillus ammoniavirescens]|nr:hypothetical protein BDN67DRAFT_971870 [Paxillus ammoniavirescens]